MFSKLKLYLKKAQVYVSPNSGLSLEKNMNPRELLNAMEFSRESLELLVLNKQDFVMKCAMYLNFINIIWQIIYTPDFIEQARYFTIVYEWSTSAAVIFLWWL